jgi:hypothetical protein
MVFVSLLVFLDNQSKSRSQFSQENFLLNFFFVMLISFLFLFKDTINAVHADGNKFSHPLHHLGKTINDLPVLAIDSFRHMYLFPDFKKLKEDGAFHLQQFVQDLHSGKLHREFHNGPDPSTPVNILIFLQFYKKKLNVKF